MYSEFGDVYHLHRQHVGSYIIDFIFVEQTQHKHATKTAMKLHADGTNATIQTATLIYLSPLVCLSNHILCCVPLD